MASAVRVCWYQDLTSLEQSCVLRRKKPTESTGKGLPSAESREEREPFWAALCASESRTQSSLCSEVGGDYPVL